MIQLKAILLLACFSFVPMKHKQAKDSWLSEHKRCKLLKKMFSLIEKYGITNSVSSHCWDSCHNYILKQTRNHLTQCFSIFFSAPTYLKDKYNISNGGFLYQGFSREGQWTSIVSAFPTQLRITDLNYSHIKVHKPSTYHIESEVHRSQKT